VSSTPEAEPAILIELVPEERDSFVSAVFFAGMDPGERIELAFIEEDATADARIRPERVLGTAAGALVQLGTAGRLGFVPDDPPKPCATPKPRAHFRCEAPSGASDYVFALSDEREDRDEGDMWRIRVRADSHGIQSPAIPIARVRRQVEAGGATYDWHAGHELELYADGSVDAAGSGGAFHDMLAAIRAARHFVFIVDWSFQPLFCPSRGAPLHRKQSIGSTLIEQALAHPELLVAIHTWEHTGAAVGGVSVAAPDDANDGGGDTLNKLAFDDRLPRRPKNVLWRATSRTGQGSTHHQKFVVMDAPRPDNRRELRVFWGGLDLTKGRFDWPSHVIDPHAPEAAPFRKRYYAADESTDDWYSPEFGDRLDMPRQPWHDIHGALTGPAAWDFVREFVGRWNVAPSLGGDVGDLGAEARAAVWKLFRKLHEDRDTFAQQYEGKRVGKWSAQVYRSLELEHWAPPDRPAKDALDQRAYALLRTTQAQGAEHSIQLAYRQNVDGAERFIYIENQFFMGSGQHWSQKSSIANDIPERLVKRILMQSSKGPFHVYVVMPMFPEGDPVDAPNLEVRRNEWCTMEYMVKALHAKLGDGWSRHLSFYFLANWRQLAPKQHSKATDRAGLVRDHMRYMVYVHSKLMLVDDRYVLFGSCNLNDRGLSGTGDSEIACGVWPSHGEERAAIAVQRFRKRLWLEHFGEAAAGWKEPGSAACVSAVTAHAWRNYVNFRSMAAPPQGHACLLPLRLVKEKDGKLVLALRPYAAKQADVGCLPDSPRFDEKWKWGPNGSSWVRVLGLAE
jgi:phosphatidylserine/phosphatidylglycerophosphate/cardiolipin synthase-like enzyme